MQIADTSLKIYITHSHEFEVRHSRCVEPKLQNSRGTFKTQLYLLAMSEWIT
jgi:hypothetical protein